MQDFEKPGVFYLGRLRADGAPLLYDSKDLVTHAVCVGMTGSGKTGLCIDLLEEAALDGVPSICIDPKGDITNLLLQFPGLRTEDFAPWVNQEDSPAQQAEIWRKGLESWGQNGARIQKLRDSADFAIYTPGSSAGLGLSVLKSFDPPVSTTDAEAYRDRVAGTASAVLSLLGIDAEPMESREHVLLSNIFSRAWGEAKSLSLEELIQEIQSPPMTRVGVLDLESFYPAKDRFKLAMALNNLLASPGFAAWLDGGALDIGKLLHTAAGKPRVSILSIAHLSDSERMFFVTLLLNEILSWTRAQSGTTNLRAIVYMDEIFGYFPPVANPPSKRPLLTLLKQARAFGVGVVLATQNPVDLDYKGLANTGTWFIGRLQTNNDRQRLLDGLGGSFDAGILADLGKRVFLMHNVHEKEPVVFESRWALSYLRGPLTRSQIQTLMAGRRAAPVTKTASQLRTVLPPEVPQAFAPVRGSHEGVVCRAHLLGAAQIRYVDSKAGVDFLEEKVFLTPMRDDSLPVQWEECTEVELDPNELESEAVQGGTFGEIPAVASKAKSYAAWNKDLITWIYSHKQYELPREQAVEKVRAKYASKVATLEERLRRAEQDVEQQKLGSVIDIGTGILGAVFGRKHATTVARDVLRGGGRYRKEAGDVEAVRQQLAEVQATIDAEIEQVQPTGIKRRRPISTFDCSPWHGFRTHRAESRLGDGGDTDTGRR
ncbi:MAG: DUF87 domain-containing protein [Bryobacteraceae bacterium]